MAVYKRGETLLASPAGRFQTNQGERGGEI